MFELEIMVAGYTVVVATTSVVISKCIGKKRLNSIDNELLRLNRSLQETEDKVKQLVLQIESHRQ